nr:TIGR02391 family protein [Caballeronia sp. GACF4]
MTTRKEAFAAALADLSEFEINWQSYFDDAEPQGIYDAALTGKVRTLLGYCRVFGWLDLVTAVENLIPIQCNAPSALEEIQGFLIPEARQRLAKVSLDEEGTSDQEFWQLIHPRIRHLARPRVESGFYGDAIESSFKEVNHSVKRLVKEKANKDADGSGLMNLAFSPSNPIIALADLHTESGRNIQQGFMQIYSGSMTGIRNPQAHGNLHPEKGVTLHLVSLASLLMWMLDQRVE